MPNIKSISITEQLLTIERGFENEAPIVISTSTLFGTGNIAQMESKANNWLANRFADGSDQYQVHIYSLSPLTYNIIVANQGVTIPPNWWGS